MINGASKFTQKGGKGTSVKSFTQSQGLTKVCDPIMPLSHCARLVKGEGDKFAYELNNLWILKPVGLNRGQGIHVVDSISQIKRLIKEYFFGREYSVGCGSVLQNK